MLTSLMVSQFCCTSQLKLRQDSTFNSAGLDYGRNSTASLSVATYIASRIVQPAIESGTHIVENSSATDLDSWLARTGKHDDAGARAGWCGGWGWGDAAVLNRTARCYWSCHCQRWKDACDVGDCWRQRHWLVRAWMYVGAPLRVFMSRLRVIFSHSLAGNPPSSVETPVGLVFLSCPHSKLPIFVNSCVRRQTLAQQREDPSHCSRSPVNISRKVNVETSIHAGLAGSKTSRKRSLLLGTGACGGFTTYSTFAVDAAQLLREQRYGISALFVTSSCIGSIVAAGAGWAVASRFSR